MKIKSGKLPQKYFTALQKLRLEIVQRKSVTTALVKSERHYERLLKESYRMQEQLRHLSHQILLAHEEERKKISRELHDEIGQILTGVNIRLTSLMNETSGNAQNIKKKIATTQRLVEKSMKTIHRFARELRPAILDDIGLIPAIDSHIKDFAKRTGISIRFKVFTYAKIDELDTVQRTAFYRVVQEALINVNKHAEASLVKMSLQRHDGTLHMEINDNGKSFSVDRMLRSRKRKRLGLLGMRERMEIIGGKFAIESSPGKGTTVYAQAPFSVPDKAISRHTRKGFR